MSLNELLVSLYGWAEGHAELLLFGSVLLPVLGIVLAWVGKLGRTDADGRLVASTLLGLSLVAVALEVAVLAVAQPLLGRSALDANAALLVAPVLCLFVSVMGVRRLFPLSELGSVRTAVDLGAFLVCLGAALWFMSRFRGWGLYFFGSFTQLLVALALVGLFLRRLFRRAFSAERRASPFH